ncbi:hypothetical protein GGS23DRAFT_430901 [Durotheca rogersii]|uniref:uncharacterized protein n=1 Tax=Durotheca rogersii TaxID=419775 RepID=UPI0022210578|nr:uncharacterized protein GGS23DRAFT_430901 [Durotheca rogersii]KAI5865513.1 hypothetical protein GGS23DRAFT_430901 [Durotheca rogersii]
MVLLSLFLTPLLCSPYTSSQCSTEGDQRKEKRRRKKEENYSFIRSSNYRSIPPLTPIFTPPPLPNIYLPTASHIISKQYRPRPPWPNPPLPVRVARVDSSLVAPVILSCLRR